MMLFLFSCLISNAYDLSKMQLQKKYKNSSSIVSYILNQVCKLIPYEIQFTKIIIHIQNSKKLSTKNHFCRDSRADAGNSGAGLTSEFRQQWFSHPKDNLPCNLTDVFCYIVLCSTRLCTTYKLDTIQDFLTDYRIQT